MAKAMRKNEARFRFYEELNDFLPVEKRKRIFTHAFYGVPGIKDPIEAIGIPHTEVDLILVNGVSVGFGYRLQHGDCVSVYPLFETFDIAPISKLRKRPLRRSTFILDVHLGKLARVLRFLGFDAKYENDYSDPALAEISVTEGRTLLTRDRRLLYRKEITHAYYLRSTDPDEQLVELFNHFDLYAQVSPFHRCAACNGRITSVDKKEILDRLEPKTVQYYDQFYRCERCRKVYWKGSHYERIKHALERRLVPPNADQSYRAHSPT